MFYTLSPEKTHMGLLINGIAKIVPCKISLKTLTLLSHKSSTLIGIRDARFPKFLKIWLRLFQKFDDLKVPIISKVWHSEIFDNSKKLMQGNFL